MRAGDPKQRPLFNVQTYRRYRQLECLNVYTTCLLLQFFVAVMILTSFVLMIVHYTNDLYEPVAVPSTIHAAGFGYGVLQNAFLLESLATVAFAGGCIFASLWLAGFSLVAVGLPPFDPVVGVSLALGRNVTAATNVQKAATVLTLRYVVLIAFEVVGICAVMFVMYMIGKAAVYHRVQLWEPNWPTRKVTARGTSHLMISCYVTTAMAWAYAFWLLVDMSLAGNIVDSRAGTGTQYAYSWTRYDSPHFILCVGVGMRIFHPAAYPIRKSDSAFLYYRTSYFVIITFVLLLGVATSLYYTFAEYAVRLLGWTPTYRVQIMYTNGVDVGQSCFMNTRCYDLVNPVHDGSATYTLIKSPVASPQTFAFNTLNQDICNIMLVVFGICVTAGHLFEVVVLSCGSAWEEGLDPENVEPTQMECTHACLTWSATTTLA